MGLALTILLFLVSMFVLIRASDWFVEAAETVGLSIGISPFVIGVTLVAFGTSLPELASSIASVLSGSPEIVIGNVVGSNITNIVLVLGVSAIVGKEIIIDKKASDNKIVMLLASALLLWFMVRDRQNPADEITVFEALLLLAGMALFILTSMLEGDREIDVENTAGWRDYTMLVVGAGLVYAGAYFTVYSIQQGSELVGIGNEIIALTAVALGTSLPEVVVSVTAVRKGKSDIAIGNVLGSNVFNTFAVIGIPGLIGPIPVPGVIQEFSIPLMVALSVLFALIFVESRINRWEGWMLIILYLYFLYKSFLV